MKSLKGLVCKVCVEENGHLLLMVLCDCVDDTVLLRKAILSVRPSLTTLVCSILQCASVLYNAVYSAV